MDAPEQNPVESISTSVSTLYSTRTSKKEDKVRNPIVFAAYSKTSTCSSSSSMKSRELSNSYSSFGSFSFASTTDNTISNTCFPSYSSSTTTIPAQSNTTSTSSSIIKPDWLKNESFNDSLIPLSRHFIPLNSQEEKICNPISHSNHGMTLDLSASTKRDMRSETKEKYSHRSRHKRKHKKKMHSRKESKLDMKRKKHLNELNKQILMDAKFIKEDPRKPSQDIWSGSDSQENELYYFDGRGDRHNIIFGCTGAFDIPKFSLRSNPFCLGITPGYRLVYSNRKREAFVELIESSSVKSVHRYTGKKNLASGTHRIKPIEKKAPLIRESDFIPLLADAEVDVGSCDISSDDYLLEKTRQLNRATREDPSNVKGWTAFIDFQDEFLKSGKTRSVLSVIEKKLELYRQALRHNPSSEDLLLGYLRLCREAWDEEKVQALWDRIFDSQHMKDAPAITMKVWLEYLHFCLSNFENFSIKKLRGVLHQAIQSFSLDCDFSEDISLLSLLTLSLLFEDGSGYNERAVALCQSLIEFNCKSSLSSEDYSVWKNDNSIKKRLFSEFWESEIPRFGEKDSKGWEYWLKENYLSFSRSFVPLDANTHTPSFIPLDANTHCISHSENFKTDEKEQYAWNENSEFQSIDDFLGQIMRESKDPVSDDLKQLESVETNNKFEDSDEASSSEMSSESEEDCIDSENGDEIEGTRNSDNDEDIILKAVYCPDSYQSLSSDKKKDLSKWFHQEMILKEKYCLPARGSEFSSFDTTNSNDLDLETGSKDPERVVMFSDIEGFLFHLQSEESKLEVVFQLLQLLGIWLPNFWSSCHYLYKTTTNKLVESNQLWDAISSNGDFGWTSGFGCEWSCWVHSGREFLEACPKMSFIRQIFSEIDTYFPSSDALASTILNFELRHDINRALVIARGLLSRNRSSIVLLNFYAYCLMKANKFKEARRVCETGLSLLDSIPKAEQKKATSLFHTYVQVIFCLKTVDSQKILLHALCCASEIMFHKQNSQDVHQLSPTRLARTRRNFSKNLYGIPEGQGSLDDVHMVILFAIFEFLVQGSDHCCEVFESSLPKFAESGHQKELLLNEYVCHIYNETELHHCSPLKARCIFERAIREYPNNVLFLYFFAKSELKSPGSFRMRMLFDEMISGKGTSAIWFFAAECEIRRKNYIEDHSLVNRIDRIFEKSLKINCLRTSATMWIYYLRFAICHGDLKYAKRIYFRGIRHAPWLKQLWSACFRDDFIDAFDVVEVEQIYHLIIEKQIRIHAEPKL